jgi:hypothetical protein
VRSGYYRKEHNNGWVLDDHQNLMGMFLPADYCAEHEWGIESLQWSFGINKHLITQPPFGIMRRKATKVPVDFIYNERRGKLIQAVMTVGWRDYMFSKEDFEKNIFNNLPQELNFKWDDREVRSAWDGKSFGIRVKGIKHVRNLRKIMRAIHENNVCVFVGGTGPFNNGGLCVAIANALPENIAKQWESHDSDTAKLYLEHEKIGIEKKICDNLKFRWGLKPYYALSPRWMFDNEKHKSKYKLIYFLNPADQDFNNHGWFTVEELEQWIEGKGPIPKANNESQKS